MEDYYFNIMEYKPGSTYVGIIWIWIPNKKVNHVTFIVAFSDLSLNQITVQSRYNGCEGTSQIWLL